MRINRSRRQLSPVKAFLIASATFTLVGLLILTLRSLDDPTTSSAAASGIDLPFRFSTTQRQREEDGETDEKSMAAGHKGCATVEEMGNDALRSGGGAGLQEQSLRVRRLIHHHFALNGASTVRALPPEDFCRHGYVIAKASEAGFGNEMYKILSAAALSIMLNRSLIIGQTRHIGINILLGITFIIPTSPSP